MVEALSVTLTLQIESLVFQVGLTCQIFCRILAPQKVKMWRNGFIVK